jgi:hypothetical protein
MRKIPILCLLIATSWGCSESTRIEVDGDGDGDADGDGDGDADGDADGDVDGDVDGDADGDSDGDVDGDSDGDADGDSDGDADGDCSLPEYSSNCFEVPFFEMRFWGLCEDGVINVHWVDREICDGEELFIDYRCSARCERGCLIWELYDWTASGRELEEVACEAEEEPLLCEPGACRVCGAPGGRRWGRQRCAADGRRWERCVEAEPLEECRLAGTYTEIAQRCCVANGFCCQDAWDADGDGDLHDSVGDCDEGGCVGGHDQTLVCQPGSCRYCDAPAYSTIGMQLCLMDGSGWSPCDETTLWPASCSEHGWYSPAAQQCCFDEGFCCQDIWDLDSDGETWESFGACLEGGCVIGP